MTLTILHIKSSHHNLQVIMNMNRPHYASSWYYLIRCLCQVRLKSIELLSEHLNEFCLPLSLMSTCTCMYIHVCLYICMYIHMYKKYMYMYIHMYRRTCTYACTYICIDIHVHVCTCMYILYIILCIDNIRHTYVHMYRLTCTYI